MKDRYKNDINRYYTEKFNPEKEEYFGNILNLAQECEGLGQILLEFSGNIKVKDGKYEDNCVNFLEILNTVNEKNKKK